MKGTHQFVFSLFAAMLIVGYPRFVAAAGVAVPDAMRGPALRDVRLEGWLGEKTDRFISRRLVDPVMRNQVFDEARQTFEFRDDDEAKVGGIWRGEFWGKVRLMPTRKGKPKKLC